MLERRSALHAVYRAGRFGNPGAPAPGLTVSEDRERAVLQVAGWADSFAAVLRVLAGATGIAVPDAFSLAAAGAGGSALFWVGVNRVWLAADADTAAAASAALAGQPAELVDLTHARTVLRLGGPAVRQVFAKGLPVDLHPAAFPPDSVAMSVIEHVAVTVHYRPADGQDGFDVYVPRGFALSFWDWLTDAALEFGYEVV